MKVHVTSKNIKEGKRGKCCECPVALAIRDVSMWIPMVLNPDIRINNKWMKVPPEVKEWITRYDCGDKVEPISFELDYTD